MDISELASDLWGNARVHAQCSDRALNSEKMTDWLTRELTRAIEGAAAVEAAKMREEVLASCNAELQGTRDKIAEARKKLGEWKKEIELFKKRQQRALKATGNMA